MADDERRAEIEAVAQALSQASEFESFATTVGAWRAAARVAIAALDRVRDARGDDEVHLSDKARDLIASREIMGEDHDPDRGLHRTYGLSDEDYRGMIQ